MRYIQKTYYLVVWLIFPIAVGVIYPYVKHDSQYVEWISTALSIYVLFFSVVIHELAHGISAKYCGDSTAEDAGRLTFNPIKHISLIGTIGVPLLLYLMKAPGIIGWAKPVPFNPINLKEHPRDQVMVTSSGPLSNFALSFIFYNLYLIGAFIFNRIYPETPLYIQIDIFSKIEIPNVSYEMFWFVLFEIVRSGMVINIVLGVFNLIPFPPLDGSWILKAILPQKAAIFISKMQVFGFILLIIALQFNLLTIFFYPAMIILLLFQYVSTICLG